MNAHVHSNQGAMAIHGSLRGYLTGFLLSVILTAIPFWLVMAHVLVRCFPSRSLPSRLSLGRQGP